MSVNNSKSMSSPTLDWRRFHELCQSESFWRGVAAGFSAQRYLFSRQKLADHIIDRVASDSVREAWGSVWELLSDALEEIETDGEIGAQSAKPVSRPKKGDSKSFAVS
jgi:hypothetical protein